MSQNDVHAQACAGNGLNILPYYMWATHAMQRKCSIVQHTAGAGGRLVLLSFLLATIVVAILVILLHNTPRR
jgi:hypothetical protein